MRSRAKRVRVKPTPAQIRYQMVELFGPGMRLPYRLETFEQRNEAMLMLARDIVA